MDTSADTLSSNILTPQANFASQWPVRTFLIWLVLACLLPGIIAATALFVYEYRTSRTQLEEDTIQTARALVQATDNQILQAQALAQGLATADSLANGDLVKFHQQARHALEQSQLGASFALVDPAGRQILNTLEAFGASLPPPGNPELVKRVFATGQPAVSNIFTSNILKRPLIAIAVPVMLDGKIIYALNISILPERFNAILNAQGLPTGWVATTLDGNGTIVSRSREAERFLGQKPAAPFLERIQAAGEGTMETVLKDGIPVLAAYTRSAATNWRVSISIPLDNLAAEFVRRFSMLALGIASLFAIGLLLARQMGRKIARSFQALMAPALALGSDAALALPSTDVKEATDVASAMVRASKLLNERTTRLQETNKTLLEKEQELEEAHCLAKFGTWHWDLETGEVIASKSAHDLCGRVIPPFGEQRGTLLSVETWERVYAATQRVDRRGSYEMELPVNHGNGTIIWVHLKCAAVRNADGEVVALRGTVLDITERKQAEEQLRASEEKYRSLFTNMTEGFALGEPILDAEGKPFDARFIEVNGAYYAQTGIAPDAFEGRSLREVLPDIEQLWIDHLCDAALTGEARRVESFNTDTQRYYDVYVFGPAPGRFAILFRDTTEQKRTGIALQESEAYLRQLIATLPSIVWTTTKEGAVDFVSERWMEYTGMSMESQLGSPFLEPIHPDDRENVAKCWREAVESVTPSNLEYRLRRHDGTYRWFNSRGTPIRDRDGQVTRWLGVVTDIDDLKRTQEALQDSEQRYRSLFNNRTSAIAHHRVIVDEHGDPVDFIIEAINDTYEQMLEVKRENVEGRLATEVFPGIRNFAYNPIQNFGRIGLGGGEGTFEVYFPPRRQWLSVYVYSPKPGQYTAIFTNITPQKEAEAALRDNEYRLSLALRAGDTAVWEVDVPSGMLLPADDLLFSTLGYAQGELTTVSDWIACIHDEERDEICQLLDEVIQGQRETYRTELRFRGKDGHWRWILCQALASQRDDQGKAVRLVGTHTNITERKIAEERVREAALHDPLTGLPNRALVFEYGSRLLAGAQRSHGRGALLFIDLDRFKPINDLYGHEIGDRVLQEVANRLTGCTRREDLVGRLGGDEFVIVLPHLNVGRHRVVTVAQHVIDSISQPFQVDTLELSISPSIGISYYPEHAADVSALIHTADLAMYQAKQSGRANYQFYTPELDQRADAAYSLEARLKNALKQGRFVLHYQPVVDIKSGKVIGAEALVRFADDEGNAVGPANFIPIAESAGLIGELGEWVATEACRQHEAWLGEGLRITLAINVSALQFRQRDFAEKLSDIIAYTGIDPVCLQIEVTESTVMECLDDAVDILRKIKLLGVKIALDDFGTGYSSLSSLSSLPLDKLKVDQSFVQRVETDQASRAVTEAIIALGRSLKLDVVGEGIESESTLRYLQEHGCNHAQGFWFSPPLPAPEFAHWYRSHGG